MAFKYRGDDRNVEDTVRRSKRTSNFDGYINQDFPTSKPKEGENCVRILPDTWEDTKKWGNQWDIRVFVHYGVGPDESTYLCLNKMEGKTCPVCEARRTAETEEERDQFKYSERAIVWVIDRNDEKAGPQVWPMPVSLSQDIYGRSLPKKKGGVIKIDHPDEGYDVFFNREGTDRRTKYVSVELDRDPTPIHDKQATQDRWLDFIEENPLPETLNYYDAAYIEKVLYGKASSKRDEEEEDTGARRGRRAPADDPPEEEETSTRRGSRRGREPEAEEEETPRGRRGRSEPAEEGEAPRGRRGRGDDPPEEEEEARPARRRGREPEAEEEETPRRGRRRSAPADDDIPSEEAEEETSTRTSRRRRSEPEAEEEVVDEESGEVTTSRRRGRSEPETEEESPSRQARRQLDGLKNRRRR
jgi:hypothetical protein